jgi:hypothetical protein
VYLMNTTLLLTKRGLSPFFVNFRTQICLLFLFIFTSFSSFVFAATLYVKQNGTGAGTNSWDNASSDFQAVINAASAGDEVWVAGGIYQPASGTSFQMKEGVRIYGGFAGNETNRSARNLTLLQNKATLRVTGPALSEMITCNLQALRCSMGSTSLAVLQVLALSTFTHHQCWSI